MATKQNVENRGSSGSGLRNSGKNGDKVHEKWLRK